MTLSPSGSLLLSLSLPKICPFCRAVEDPLEEGMATHSSNLAGKIPWTEEPGGLQSMRVAKSQTRPKQRSMSTHED